MTTTCRGYLSEVNTPFRRNIDGDYSYDNKGRLTSYGIPLLGNTYNYLFDTMGRPKELNLGCGP